MKKILSFIIAVGLLGLISCEKWIDPKVNDNPDALTSVPLYLLLPNIEVGYAYITGDFDVVGNTGIWLNYFAGVDRQASAVNSYTQASDDVNNLWGSYYSGIMTDCKKIIEQSKEAGKESPHYAGVAKVILAASLGNVTSLWGDVPYSEAFKGAENLHPVYDPQEQIYQTIQSTLDEAITDLSATENYYPLQNDLIYDGDLDLWIKLAYSLKARYAMHLSKKGEDAAATAVLTALNNGLASNNENANLYFTNATPTENNPMFQFVDQRSGYIEPDPDFAAMLAGDPRADVLANDDITLNAYTQPDAPVSIMTYVEVLFLKAEAYFIKNNPIEAANAYNDALEASLRQFGVYDNAWFNANKLDQTTITRQAIIVGKYKALAATLEPYNDWRRTGFPVLTINQPNVNQNKIPVRFLYPTDERTYNRNCPSGVGLNDKPWAFQ